MYRLCSIVLILKLGGFFPWRSYTCREILHPFYSVRASIFELCDSSESYCTKKNRICERNREVKFVDRGGGILTREDIWDSDIVVC